MKGYKQNAIKNYFPMPNEIFSLGLSSGEISVYSYLMFCEDRKTFQCYPIYKTIGKAVKMSQNTVRKYVAKLEDKHLITTEPTKVYTSSGMVRNGNLLYTILPIQQAVDYFHEQQILKVNEEFLKAKVKNTLNNSVKSHSKTAV